MESNKIVKILRNIVIFFFIIMLSLIIYFQIKVEIYRNDLIKLYNFSYLKRDRIRYVPFVYFLIESKVFNKNKCYFMNISMPYKEYEKVNNIVRKHNEEFFMRFNIEYNAYLMYCYYDIKNLKCE